MEGTTRPEAAEAARLAAMTSAERERAGYIEGLRKLADALELDPHLELPYAGSGSPLTVIPHGAGAQRAQLVAWARVLARHGQLDRRVRENRDGSSNFDLTGTIGGVHIMVIAGRDAVCTKVVTGTREITETVKDPEKLAEVPEIEVTRTEDIIEWQCEPVTAPAGTDVAA